MSTTEQDSVYLDTEFVDELHELEAHEAALERRTRSLEFSGPLALILSIVALGLGLGAFIVALDKDAGSSDTAAGSSAAPARSAPAPVTSSGGMMMMKGYGGHGSFTTAQMNAAARGTIYVQLGDYWAAPTVPTVRAGKITFIAHNAGRVPHELMVERMPIKFDAPLQPNEEAAQGMIEDMGPGGHGRMTMRLKPGKYMLFCNVEGHYAAGQHIEFTVKS